MASENTNMEPLLEPGQGYSLSRTQPSNWNLTFATMGNARRRSITSHALSQLDGDKAINIQQPIPEADQERSASRDSLQHHQSFELLHSRHRRVAPGCHYSSPPTWTTKGGLADSSLLIAIVYIGDTQVTTANSLLVAFAESDGTSGVARGTTKIAIVKDKQGQYLYFFLLGAGFSGSETGAPMTLQIYDSATGCIFNILQHPTFSSMPQGTVSAPLIFNATIPPSCTSDQYLVGGSTCNNLTQCSLGNTFEQVPPTPTSDRTCGLCQLCSSGEFANQSCTLTSDTQCSHCSSCTESSNWQFSPCTSTSDTVCRSCSACAPTSYASKNCSLSSDTVCVSCSNCPSSYFQQIPCSTYTDTVCRKCSGCSSENYISQSCTATTDTQCASCSVCSPGTYRFHPCTSTSNTDCASCTSCLQGQYTSSGCTIYNNTACSDCTVCNSLTQYQTASCTMTGDTVCANLTICSGSDCKSPSCYGSMHFQTVPATPTSNRACQAVSLCSTGSTFQSVAPTPTSDQSCQKCGTCVSGSTFLTSACTLTSNTVCSNCRTCGSGEYQNAVCTLSSNTDCQPCTTCGAGQYETAPCTATSNRICANLTQCHLGTSYELYFGSASSDRVCRNCSKCSFGQYQAQNCTLLADASCKTCGTCLGNTFISQHCTSFSDTVCRPCLQCTPGIQYVGSMCTSTTDTVCKSCTSCKSSQYYTRNCSIGFDAVCGDCSTCPQGSFQSQSCSTFKNSVCISCRTCKADEFLSEGCTQTSDTVCRNCSTCPSTTYRLSPCTSTSDAVCHNCATCSSGSTYAIQQCTPTSDRHCAPCRTCGPNEYETLPCTVTTNRVCANLTTCPNSDCTSSSCYHAMQYQSVAPTATSDRICSPVHLCQLGLTHQSVAPTNVSDQRCSQCTPCPNNRVQQQACNLINNTICEGCSTCGSGEYVTEPCTSTSDTVCSLCRKCTLGTQYVASPCTESNNTDCTDCTKCQSDHFVSQNCSISTDTICSSCSSCPVGQYKSQFCTSFADTVCSPCSSCKSSEYISVPCTSTSDTVCRSCSSCKSGSGQYLALGCTKTSDAVCTNCTRCAFYEYESHPCELTSNRLCNNLTTCTNSECTSPSCYHSMQFQSVAATITSDRVCHSVTLCSANISYQTVAPTPTSDQVCGKCTNSCSLGSTYQTAACTLTSNIVCSKCNACGQGQFISRNCTATTDSTCANCMTCSSGTYQTQACSVYSNTNCSKCTDCASFSRHYLSAACTNTADSVCSLCKNCGTGAFELSPCTPTADTQCKQCATCDSGTFAAQPCTSLLDTVCKNCTTCSIGVSYASHPCTSSNDTDCVKLTECTKGLQYELKEATITSDRQCQSLTNCIINEEYEILPPTATTDRACRALTVCNSSYYQLTAPTPTTDRVCRPITVYAPPVDFGNGPSPGYLLGDTFFNSNGQSLQSLGLFDGNAESTKVSVGVTLGGVVANTTVTLTPSTSEFITGMIISEQVLWPDFPHFAAMLQVSDSNFNVATSPTEVLLIVTQVGSGNIVSFTCVTENTTGTCSISATIPNTWFTTQDVAVSVVGRIQNTGISVTLPGLTLKALPTKLARRSLLSSGMAIVMPMHSLFPGNQFAVQVYVQAGYYATNTWQFEFLSESADLKVSSVNVDPSVWFTTQLPVSNGIIINGSPQDAAARPQGVYTAVENICNVTLSISAAAAPNQNYSLIAQVLKLFNQQQQQPISPNTYALSEDRYGFHAGAGNVWVSAPVVTGILPFVAQPLLINTAVLTGIPSSQPIKIYIGRADGTISMASISPQLFSCTSNNTNALQVDAGCASISLSGQESTGASAITVSVVYLATGVSNSFNTRVLYPKLPLSVVLDVPQMHMIQGLHNASASCAPIYQQSHLKASTYFTYPGWSGFGQPAIVTPLISDRLSSNNSDIVRILPATTTLEAIQPGTATISITSPSGRALGSTSATVSSTFVHVIYLVAVVIESISLSVSPSISSTLGPVTATAIINSNLTIVDQTAAVVVQAIFDDGSRMDLTPNLGLNISSLDPKVIQVSMNNPMTVVAVGTGRGALIQATWEGAFGNGCQPGGVLAQATAYVTVDILPPTNAETLVAHTRMALPSDKPAISVGIPTSSSVEIYLDFPWGRESMTLDKRTIFSASATNNVFMVNITDSSVTLVPLSVGTGRLNISFAHLSITTSTLITVVSTVELITSGNPFPGYVDSSSFHPSTLHPIADTGVWESVILSCTLRFSDNTTMPAVTSNFSSSNMSLVTLSNTGVSHIPSSVIVKTDVDVSFYCLYEGLNGNPITLRLSGTNVQISNFSFVNFPSTLSGITNQAVSQISFSIFLTDGFELPASALFPVSNADFQVSQMVSFNISDPSIISADINGAITLLNNSYVLESVNIASRHSAAQAEIFFACNLEPEVGDVDLGQPTGLPLSPVTVGSIVHIPVRVNSGSTGVASLELQVLFDPTLVTFVSLSTGSGWSSGQYDDNTDTLSSGYIRFGGILSSPLAGTNELFVLTFTAKATGVAQFSGIVTTLADENGNNIAQSPLRHFVAGNVKMLITSNQRRSVHFDDAMENGHKQAGRELEKEAFDYSGRLTEMDRVHLRVLEQESALQMNKVLTSIQAAETAHITAAYVNSDRRITSLLYPAVGSYRRSLFRRDCPMPCSSCPQPRQTGDCNFDCIFDIRDAAFASNFLNWIVANDSRAQVLHDQLLALDADGSGNIDTQDVDFLLRANFQKYFFVTDLVITPVNLENCVLGIQATAVTGGAGLGDVPVDPARSFLYLNLQSVSRNNILGSQMQSSTILAGSLDPTAGFSPNSVVLSTQGNSSNFGIFSFRMASSLSDYEIGISLIQGTLGPTGDASSERTLFMTGVHAPPYTFNDISLFNLTINSNAPLVIDPQNFNAYKTMQNPETSLACQQARTCDFPLSFQIEAATILSPPKCQAIKTCNVSSEYQSAAATNVTDAICSLLTVCNKTYPLQSAAPTYTSDRNCTSAPSTTVAPINAASSSGSSSSFPISAVIGAVVGFICLLLIIILVIYYRRRRRQDTKPPRDTSNSRLRSLRTHQGEFDFTQPQLAPVGTEGSNPVLLSSRMRGSTAPVYADIDDENGEAPKYRDHMVKRVDRVQYRSIVKNRKGSRN